MEVYGIIGIDLFCGNFYLFEEVVVFGVDYVMGIENIDIGGLVMIWVVVKNYVYVIVVIDLVDYVEVFFVLDINDGKVFLFFCKLFVLKVFVWIVVYDVVVFNWFVD